MEQGNILIERSNESKRKFIDMITEMRKDYKAGKMTMAITDIVVYCKAYGITCPGKNVIEPLVTKETEPSETEILAMRDRFMTKLKAKQRASKERRKEEKKNSSGLQKMFSGAKEFMSGELQQKIEKSEGKGALEIQIRNAITLLKSQGYKIQKPEVKYIEV